MAEQNKQIFREKSLTRISSPEQLGEYLKVTNPGVWAILAAIIILLVGLFAWGMSGELETLASGTAFVESGQAQITAADGSTLAGGMTVRFGEQEYTISTAEEDENGSIAYASVNMADGKYDVQIVTERIHPIRFLFD